MSTLADALRDPIWLPPNRPSRFYRGGRLLASFRGELDATDDHRPEDWVGSATTTWTPPGAEPSKYGPSAVEVAGLRLGLDEVLARAPEALVGRPWLERAGPSLGLLVKLLDAGVRLPVHAHPTRDAAGRLLGSRFGKTEAWIVLGTRESEPGPRVWIGFREGMDRDQLRAWIDGQDVDALLRSLVEYSVGPGDAFLVPGGTPHAIGSGVFLLELQEPTDFSVLAESRGIPVSPEDASLGLGWDRAVEFFDTAPAADQRRGTPGAAAGAHAEPVDVLGPDANPYFRAFRMTVDGRRPWPFEPSYAVAVVVGGHGEIRGPRATLRVERGATVAIPAAAAAEVTLSGRGLELVVCLPPDPEALTGDPLG
jgi:mannose-6-phosphate isomerase